MSYTMQSTLEPLCPNYSMRLVVLFAPTDAAITRRLFGAFATFLKVHFLFTSPSLQRQARHETSYSTVCSNLLHRVLAQTSASTFLKLSYTTRLDNSFNLAQHKTTNCQKKSHASAIRHAAQRQDLLLYCQA